MHYICNNLAIKESGLSLDSMWLIKFLNNRIKSFLGKPTFLRLFGLIKKREIKKVQKL